MSQENQRYRSGPQSVVTGVIQAGKICEDGDLVALDAGYVVSGRAFDTSGAGAGTIDADFKAKFLGVLIQGATSGKETKDTPCVVATTGTYEYDILPANLPNDVPPGTPIGVTSSPTTMPPQTVDIAASKAVAIALVARQTNKGKSKIEVEIFSTIMGNPLA